LAGEKGIWIEDYVHAGGAWTYGPTTWTGGPTGGITNLIGNRLMSGSMIIDRTLTTTERAQVVANLMAQGAPGVWELGAELVNPASWDDIDTGTGTSTVTDGTITVVGTDASNRGIRRQAVSLISGGLALFSATSTITSGTWFAGPGTTSAFPPSLSAQFVTQGKVTAFYTAQAASSWLFVWSSPAGANAAISAPSFKTVNLNTAP
jgi:hypothetical protein